MQALRSNIATARATTRSEVSNGTRLLQNVDLRSSSARRFRDLVRAYEGELGGDLSEGEHTRHRRQVTDVAVDHAEEADHSRLVGGYRIEVAHISKKSRFPKFASA